MSRSVNAMPPATSGPHSQEKTVTSSRPLAGILPAVPTPVDAGGAPDVGRFLVHARWALAQGCHGLNVLGTTGEANCLSTGQRKAVMEAAATALDGTPLMVGTGTPDLATTIELTRHACALGYAGALVLPPWYYKNVSDDGLFAWYERLIAGTADAPIPLYFYNFPHMTGVPLSLQLMGRLKAAFPRRIAGVKDSSGDFALSAALVDIGDFDVFPGNEMALSAQGAPRYAGCISATVNVTAPLAVRFWANRDDARLRRRIDETRTALSAFPFVPAVKYLLSRIHDDPEFERVLVPHLPLDAGRKARLDELRLD